MTRTMHSAHPRERLQVGQSRRSNAAKRSLAVERGGRELLALLDRVPRRQPGSPYADKPAGCYLTPVEARAASNSLGRVFPSDG